MGRRQVIVHFFGQHSNLYQCLNGKHEFADHWVGFWPALREELANHDMDLVVDDGSIQQRPDNILWCIDLPGKRAELLKLLRRIVTKTRVFQQVESPLSHPARLNPANIDWAHALISYDKKFLDEANIRLPRPTLFRSLSVSLRRPRSWDNSWSDRRPITMVNTNQAYGLLRRGVPGSQIAYWYASGFDIRCKDVIEMLSSERYGLRRRLALAVSSSSPKGIPFDSGLDIFGANWTGEPISWVHRFWRPRSFPNSKGRLAQDKLELLTNYRFTVAFENYQGDRNYISEKMIDPILAGSVPIYLGDACIASVIPSNVFIDARDFKSIPSLVAFLYRMSESQWATYFKAGMTFLATEQALRFCAYEHAKSTALFLSALSPSHD